MTTEHTPDWLDNELWTVEQANELIRRYRVHDELVTALVETRDYFLDDLLTGDDGPKFRYILHIIEEAIDEVRGIGQNIDVIA